MAKKTSYLTELIERHERWKAEGGERVEEEEEMVCSRDREMKTSNVVFEHMNRLRFAIYLRTKSPPRRLFSEKSTGSIGKKTF